MVRCPVCESARVVVVLSPSRRAFCVRCGSRWIQEGGLQRAITYSREDAEIVAIRPAGVSQLFFTNGMTCNAASTVAPPMKCEL